MSDIVLSASVRQNLLSLQSTADLLATTQTRLATGKKVNTALDNPTNYFTAQKLDSRASDINNLLDSIGNGVQILQAADTGITSLQKLVDTAKSIANQALQTQLGYTKSSVTSGTNQGATAGNLLGTTPAVPSYSNGTAVFDNHMGAGTAVTLTGAAVTNAQAQDAVAATITGTVVNDGAAAAVLGTAKLGAAATTDMDLSGLAVGSKLVVNGVSFTFDGSSATSTADITGTAAAGFTVNTGAATTATLDDLLTAIGTAAGGTATLGTGADAGKITVTGTTTADLDFTGSSTDALTAFGLDAATAPISPTLSTTAGSTHDVNISSSTTLSGDTTAALGTGVTTLGTAPANGSSFTVNGKTISFYTGTTAPTAVAGTTFISVDTQTVGDVLTAIDNAIGTAGSATVDATTGKISINSGTAQDLVIKDGTTGALGAFGLTATAGTTKVLADPAKQARISGSSLLSSTAGTTSTGLKDAITTTDTITVGSGTTQKTIAFYDSGAGGAAGTNANTTYLDLKTATVDDVMAAIDDITKAPIASSITGGRISITAGTDQDLVLGDGQNGDTLAKLGLTAGNTPKSTAETAGLDGETLVIGAVGDSTAPSVITFGADDSAGEVSTLDELNAQLLKNNLQASIDTKGSLTITTTNDAASKDIPSISGSVTDTGGIFAGKTINEAVTDQDSQSTRADLVSQYNNVIDQIRTTAQDSSFNGVNLLNGDQLKMVFNETGTSTLNITGVTFDPAGLGLGTLLSGTDFIDNGATNKVLDSLSAASSTLRSQASALGSNLSVVQTRQDFNKNLINVLQTGSSNLTLADTNEEAANSQALSTRQSIAVSALALANQSQQSVLQLLR
jgi:flagellin-like hook-associated protein FlgL